MSEQQTKKPTVKELFLKPADEIQTFLGGVYEHSAWVAEQLILQKNNNNTDTNYETVTELANAMKQIVNNADNETKLKLLRAHPDLCEKVGSTKLEELTEASREEQSNAGLQSLTDEELERFTTLNKAYKEKFGFPFILAVRNATKHTVLGAMAVRVSNSEQEEFTQALTQVHKIAWMRLLQSLDTSDAKGFLTCHVLDTAKGCPAAGMRIELFDLSGDGSSSRIGSFVTNADGRLDGGPALKGGTEFVVGRYEWVFHVGDYFAGDLSVSGTPFLDTVPLRFGIDNPDDHYHVPLLVSPWSYSTYRGS